MDEKVESALKFIEEQLNTFGRNKVGVANSFGKDSIVVMDLVAQIAPELPVIWLKTPFLPQETVDYAYKVIKKYNLNIHIARSKLENDKEFMENVVIKPKLWYTSPEQCCGIFKVQPAKDAVKELNLDAWFTGLRHTESEKRSMYDKVWKTGNFTKLNPIIDFTEADVWRYIATRQIPIHPWYKDGFRSLGCSPCSTPNQWGCERGGRWFGTIMAAGETTDTKVAQLRYPLSTFT